MKKKYFQQYREIGELLEVTNELAGKINIIPTIQN